MPAPRDLRVLYLARGDDEGVRRDESPDAPADEDERREALSECLRHVQLDAVLSSRARPALATAAPTAEWHGLEVDAVAAFDDIRMGVHQARTRYPEDREAEALQRWQSNPWRYTLPGAEPTTNFVERVTTALRATMSEHAGRSVLIVANRTTNQVILGTLLGWPKDQWFDVAPAPKYLYRIDLGGFAPFVETTTVGGPSTGVAVDGFVAQ